MIKNLRKYYKEQPLQIILFAALFVRLLAVIFSKGFGWIDDQFLIVEVAQSWADGGDYYKWLPGTDGNFGPEKFSFFYTGFIYFVLKFLQFTGIQDPQAKMFIIRLIHALWSLISVYYSYKIASKFSNKKNALNVAWIMAIFWFFPFLSVRTLIEFVSVPPVIVAMYLIVKDKKNLTNFLVAGLIMGIAFSIRLQTAIIGMGFGLVLLYQKQIKSALLLALGFFVSIFIFQGLVDYYFWGYPFAQLITYVNYNLHSAGAYTVGPWYVYILFLLGVLIPPFSIQLFGGLFTNWRKYLIFLVPIIIFMVFHSWYANKQERFVITIMPLIIIAGVCGWNEFVEMKNSSGLNKFNKVSTKIFWVLNLLLLLPVSTMYSKKARVESMTYLSKYKEINYFALEDIHRNVTRFPPLYYLNNWVDYESIMQDTDFNKLIKDKNWSEVSNQPDFVLFYQPADLEERVEKMKQTLPGLVYETTIYPGNADKVLHWLNPINANENIYIYRNSLKIKNPR